MSWFKKGMTIEGTRNGTKIGLHGGFVSTVELSLDLTEDMNGDIYTCEARNVQMQRASLDAETLNILCKYLSLISKRIVLAALILNNSLMFLIGLIRIVKEIYNSLTFLYV